MENKKGRTENGLCRKNRLGGNVLIEINENIEEKTTNEKIENGEKQNLSEETETGVTYYPINEDVARRAKEMNSFFDYVPGSATKAYRESVDQAAEMAKKQKEEVDPIYHEKIDRLLDTYARKLADNLNQGYAIDVRVPSVLVAGASNFPTRKKERQNGARARNMEEWRQVQGLLDKIRGAGTSGIRSDHPHALEQLEQKLKKLEASQQFMKDVNAFYRKNGTLEGCPVLKAEQAEKIKASMAQSWHPQSKPFPSYALTNNGAEIRRIKSRIKELTYQAEVGFCGWEFEGGHAVANQEANRLQLFFEEKPSAEQRAELKHQGFRWAPNAEAWQRQLNQQAISAAGRIAFVKPLSGRTVQELQPKAEKKNKRKEAEAR